MRGDPDTIRLTVDGSKCDGHGICALIIPERISLDAWGFADVARTLARAKRAVNACPVRALTLAGPVAVRLGRGAAALPKERV